MMHSPFSNARSYRDLLNVRDNTSPYQFDSLFSDSGWGNRALSRKKFKLLRRIDEKLRSVLGPEELVFLVTSGSAVSFWEQMFLGWAMFYINRTAVILTSSRILLMQIDSRLRPRELLSQIQYRSIKKIGRTPFGNTAVKLENGKSIVFTRIARKDRKAIGAVVDRIRDKNDEMPGQREGLEKLCPYCFEPVAARPVECPHCGGGFKSPTRAGILSLILPGLGDIYLGHWKLAIAELLVISLIWLGAVIPDPKGPPVTVVEFVVTAFFILLIFHGSDALATRYIALQGLYPAVAPSRAAPGRSDT